MRYLILLLGLVLATSAFAEGFYERAPVDYENGQENNEISRLQTKIGNGFELKYDRKHGYLKSVLKALNIPHSSQTIVFSKTSLQRKKISPSTPRALYFNENTYIGWIENSDMLEIGVADKNLGAVFYTLSQRRSEAPKFERDDSCLSCHASGRTGNEPGFFIRSVTPDKTGEPIARAGEDRVNHSTPLAMRWGGWFVTADKLSVAHRGNAMAEKDGVYKLTSVPAKSLKDLEHYFDADKFLAQTSDIDSLLILEHQVEMHNIFVQTKYRSFHALHNEKVINKALGESGRRDSTKRILSNAADEILDYMLFVDEVSLAKIDIKSSSTFAADFSQGKPVSSTGKSLFKFDLQKRLSSLPCSWLIYSDSFSCLPKELTDLVLQRLKELLLSDELPDKYIHLRSFKKDIHQLLMETHKAYKEA